MSAERFQGGSSESELDENARAGALLLAPASEAMLELEMTDAAASPAWRAVPLRLLMSCLFVNAMALMTAIAAALLMKRPPHALFSEGSFITAFSSLQLVVVAGLCLWIFAIRREQARLGGRKTGAWLWLWLALGVSLVAIDEAAGVHEFVDHQIHRLLGLRQTPWTDRIDDLIVAGYGLCGLGLLYAHRRALRVYRQARPLVLAGFILFFAMVAMDLLTNSYWASPRSLDKLVNVSLLGAWSNVVEDSLKLFSEAVFIAAFVHCARLARIRGQIADDAAPVV